MKAIILERRGDWAALLCEDGTFVKRRVSGEVGETVELTAEVVAFPPARKNRWLRGAVAAALALSITGGTMGYMGGTASAYVSLDVEDSAIELTVNHFGRVIEVSALSDDAAELAESLSNEVRHRPVEEALNHTMLRLRDEGYVDDEGATVVAGVASDNSKRKEKLTKAVTDAVDDRLFAVTESSRAEREQAREQHVSVGRFGMERDHLELPAREEAAAEAQHEPPPQSEPSVPVSTAENGIPADPRPTEPMMSDAPPQGERVGQPNAPQREMTEKRREEAPTQDDAPPDVQEHQPPQDDAPQTERDDIRPQDDAPNENDGAAKEQPQRNDEPQEQRPQDRELPNAPERQEHPTDDTAPNRQDNGYTHNQHEEGGEREWHGTNAPAGNYPIEIFYNNGDIVDNELSALSPAIQNGSITIAK